MGSSKKNETEEQLIIEAFINVIKNDIVLSDQGSSITEELARARKKY